MQKKEVKKKHLLFVVDHFHPYKGGLQQFVLQLAKRCKFENYRVSVLTYNYDPKHLEIVETVEGVTVYRLPSSALLGKTYTCPHFLSSAYHKMLHNLETRDVDVVITNTRFFTSSVIGARFAKRIGAEYIHIEHGNSHVTHPNPIVAFGAWFFDITFGRYVMSSADKVIAISQAGVSFCKKLGARGDVAVVHNSTDVSLFTQLQKQERDDVLRKYNLDGTKTLILFTGRLIEAKGIQHLFPVLKKVSFSTTLVIIGEGPYEATLRALSQQYGIDTKFLGVRPLIEVVPLTLACDICVNPSYSEGIPTNILEGGAARKAVIATDVGGTREIIQSSKEGLLIPPRDEDALLAAFEHFKSQGVRVSCGIHLRRRIEKEFDWTTSTKHFLDIVESVGKERKSK